MRRQGLPARQPPQQPQIQPPVQPPAQAQSSENNVVQLEDPCIGERNAAQPFSQEPTVDYVMYEPYVVNKNLDGNDTENVVELATGGPIAPTVEQLSANDLRLAESNKVLAPESESNQCDPAVGLAIFDLDTRRIVYFQES